jgi:hypothetical protein
MKNHYTLEEQKKIFLESVPNINGTEAQNIAVITSCWTFAMIKALWISLRKIANGK